MFLNILKVISTKFNLLFIYKSLYKYFLKLTNSALKFVTLVCDPDLNNNDNSIAFRVSYKFRQFLWCRQRAPDRVSIGHQKKPMVERSHASFKHKNSTFRQILVIKYIICLLNTFLCCYSSLLIIY